MANDDITIQVLREIRDSIKRLEVAGAETNARLDEHIMTTRTAFEDVGRRIVESEIRTSTAITGLAGTMTDIRDLLRDRLDLRDRVERCEHDIAELKHRLA